MERIPETGSLRAWILAARPKTLSGAAAPVLMGGAAAWQELGGADGFAGGGFSFGIFSLCLAFAFLMQIDANFINDYFDFRKGNDSVGRLGPKRACTEGWITPGAMKSGIIVTTVAACIAGLPLAFYGGWGLVAVGMACVLFCFLYTTFLSYKGMGDVLVLVFFGLVPVGFTYCLLTGRWTWEILPVAVACGLATDCLLIVNNYRDLEQDRASGKMTLAVRLGPVRTLRLYYAAGTIAAALAAVQVCLALSVLHAVPLLLYLFLHLSVASRIRRTEGRALNALLGETSRNILTLSLVYTAVNLF